MAGRARCALRGGEQGAQHFAKASSFQFGIYLEFEIWDSQDVMAPRTRIITLNLGSQSIELAEFRTATPGDLVLCSYGSREILVEPGEKGIRVPQMTAAVCELLEELHIE